MWNSCQRYRIIKPCRELLQLQRCKVLNPHCLLQKINDVSQQIMQLQPIVQTHELQNSNTFQNWWRFYANGQKPRAYSKLKRIWNANQRYEDRIKNPRAANFLKIFTREDPEKLGKFYDKMYKNFESCFTSRHSCEGQILKVKRYRQRKVKPVEIVKVIKVPYKIYKVSDVKSYRKTDHIGNGDYTTSMDFNLEEQKFKSKEKLNKMIKRKHVKNEQKKLSEERLEETLDKNSKRKSNKNKKEVLSEEIVEEKLDEDKNGELTENNLEENVKQDTKQKRKRKFQKQLKNKVEGEEEGEVGEVTENTHSNPEDTANLDRKLNKTIERIFEKRSKNKQKVISEEIREDKLSENVEKKQVKSVSEMGQVSKESLISFRIESRKQSSYMKPAWGKQKLTRSMKLKIALDKEQQKQIEEKHSNSFETANLSGSHRRSTYAKPSWGSKSSSQNNHYFKHDFIRPTERRTSSASIKNHMLSPKVSILSVNYNTDSDWKKEESYTKIEENSIDMKTKMPYLTHIKVKGTRKSNIQSSWPSVKRQKELPKDVVKETHSISADSNGDYSKNNTKSNSFKSEHSNVFNKLNEGSFSILFGRMSLERVFRKNNERDNCSKISSIDLLKNYDIMIRYLDNIGFTFNSPNSKPRNWPLPFESDFLQQQRRERRPIKRKFVNISNSEQNNEQDKKINDKTMKATLSNADQCKICFQVYHREPDQPYMLDMRRKMQRIELNNYYKSKLLPKCKIPTKTKEKRNQPKKITIVEQGNRLENTQSMRKNLDLCYELLCHCQQIVDNTLTQNRCIERSMY